MRKGGWDSSSFSLFLSFIHPRISRETAAKAVMMRQSVSIILSCCGQFCGLTNIYIGFSDIWELHKIRSKLLFYLWYGILHYTIYPSSTPPATHPYVFNSVICRNDFLQFHPIFFFPDAWFFLRCHGVSRTQPWIQPLKCRSIFVLTTRFII